MEPALVRRVATGILIACLVLGAGVWSWLRAEWSHRARETIQPAVGGVLARAEPQPDQRPQTVQQRPAPPAPVAARGGARESLAHQVQPGESLFRIAKQYGVSVAELQKANGLSTDLIFPGQALLVPGGYTVSAAAVRNAFAWPVLAPISSSFGERWGRRHNGVDLAANQGDSIRASRDGVVLVAGNVPGYGQTLILSHADGSQTLYGHSSRLLVTMGQRVKQGQVIALVGSTGNSTGPHLHFEIIINGQPRDPLLYLPRR